MSPPQLVPQPCCKSNYRSFSSLFSRWDISLTGGSPAHLYWPGRKRRWVIILPEAEPYWSKLHLIAASYEPWVTREGTYLVVHCCGMEAVEKATWGCLAQPIPSHLVLEGVRVSTPLWKPTRESSAHHRQSGDKNCNTLWYTSPYPSKTLVGTASHSISIFSSAFPPHLILHAHRKNMSLNNHAWGLGLYLGKPSTTEPGDAHSR